MLAPPRHPPQPEIPIDIPPARRRLAQSPFWWRPCRLILGAEERGNQTNDGLPPSGVNPATSR